MLKSTLAFAILLLAHFSFAQSVAVSAAVIEDESAELEKHLMYLASDELGGRRTTSAGGELAAEYIAKYFKNYGVKPIPESDGYFQQIPFNNVSPASSGSMELGGTKFLLNENMLILTGEKVAFSKPVVFAGYGWVDATTGSDDYANLDVTGKIVIVLPGTPAGQSPMDVFLSMKEKQQFASERGAAALFELYRLNFPWEYFKNYFGRERIEVADGDDKGTGMIYGWLKESSPNPVPEIEKGTAMKGNLNTSGVVTERLKASNVVGYIEGADENLKKEYIVLSAHYDHVGIGKEGGAPYTQEDSIFNGARDNGIGTVALMAAAKSLAANPPRRSILLLACTGEEMGLLGSAWFVDHPVVPLEQMVYNLNTDGAGYNSTSLITVIGLKRTNVDELLRSASEAEGLELVGDPAPEQGLYERSDNISFAKKGIPAIDIAPGMTGMDDAILKYYHQAIDNPDTLDYEYLFRFSKAFTNMARMIANKEEPLEWMPGDKFAK